MNKEKLLQQRDDLKKQLLDINAQLKLIRLAEREDARKAKKPLKEFQFRKRMERFFDYLCDPQATYASLGRKYSVSPSAIRVAIWKTLVELRNSDALVFINEQLGTSLERANFCGSAEELRNKFEIHQKLKELICSLEYQDWQRIRFANRSHK